MEDCLMFNLSHKEFKDATALPLQQCEIIAALAKLQISFNDTTKPGETLIKALDRRGFSLKQYKEFLKAAQNTKVIHTYYKPSVKIAILIANEKYVDLAKLATPCKDCDMLKSSLTNLGFTVVLIRNCLSKDVKGVLSKIFDVVPENSYCFIFYAGHGCEICNTKFMLDVQCPSENMTSQSCITENYLLKQIAKCKPELCVLIMDMCRVNLDRETNPQLFASILQTEQYSIDNIKNLIITYSTSSAQSAYEVLQIECSRTIDSNMTFELQTGDTDKIVPVSSQYVSSLCTRLMDNLDVSGLLDEVHGDVENSMKKQRPIKVQCGVAKRSLYDPAKGNTTDLLKKLQEIGNLFSVDIIVS